MSTAERKGDLVAQVQRMAGEGIDLAVDVAVLQRALIMWISTHTAIGDEDPTAAYSEVTRQIRRYAAGLHRTRLAFPDVHAKGQRKGRPVSHSLRNLRALLAAYKATCRYNEMTHRLELDSPAITCAPERRANMEPIWWRHLCDQHGLAKDTASEYLALVADEYHPVCEWITSQTWDGVDRVQQLLATVDTDDELAPVLIRKWLTQCVAAVAGGEGFRPAGVLVFQGPQGCGKTTWCRSLVPAGRPWAAIGMHLDPTKRDDVQAITRYWIAELGELDATFRRADIAALKAFVDRDKDVYRSAYARREEEVRRRTVLFASVNRPAFLADDTGNRRWWTVRVRKCDWAHGIDLGQLWAQLWVEYHGGAGYRLTDDERIALDLSNAGFERIDPLESDLWEVWEPVRGRAGWDQVLPTERHTVRQIVEALPDVHRQSSTYAQTSRRVADLMRQANATEGRIGRARSLGFAVVRQVPLPGSS